MTVHNTRTSTFTHEVQLVQLSFRLDRMLIALHHGTTLVSIIFLQV